MEQPETEVLAKLIRLNTRCPAAVQHVYRIAVGSPDCKAALKALEASTKDGTMAAGASSLADPEMIRLVEARPEVRTILRRTPRLSEVEPSVLAVLASIADVRPGSGGVPVTEDGPFSYIATRTADEDGTTSSGRLAQRLTQTFTLRLIELSERLPVFLATLRSMCGRDDYRDIVNEFDRRLTPTPATSGSPRVTVSEEVELLLGACQAAPGSPVDPGIVYGPPRVSQIPMELIIAFPADQPLAADWPGSTAGIEALMERTEHADKLLAEMRLSNPEIDRPIQLRLDAALHLLARRRFVKTQMLEFGWPKLLSYVRAPGGQRRLRELERAVLDPSRLPALGERWKEFLEDERLIDFLSLPPYFMDMPAAELDGLEFESADDTAASDVAAGSGMAADPADELTEFGDYADAHFTLSPLDQGAPEAGFDGSTDLAGAVVRARFAPSIGDMHKEVGIIIPVQRIRGLLDGLSYAYRESYGPPERASRDIAVSAGPPPDDILEQVGGLLWSALFSEAELLRPLLDFLDREKRARLIITCTEPRVDDMPWECLYLPTLHLFAGLTLKISVTRNVPEPVSLVRRDLGTSVRVLIVSSLPSKVPPLNADQEIALVRRATEAAERSGRLRLDVLENPDQDLLQQKLRVFRPHIFHFIGHGGIWRDGQGALLLTGEDGNPVEATAMHTGTLLRDHGILFALLNSCYAGVTGSDIAGSVARVLVEQGVPVAVAPTRNILDRTALQFAREFYSALMDGYTIEAAVVEARKLLSVKGWDWSTYVIYSTDRSRRPDFWTPVFH
jgi:hypothetical protein